MGIKLYIVEEQEVYREAFRTTLSSKPFIELVGVSGAEGLNQLRKLVSAFDPDVLLVGVRALKSELVEEIIKTRHESRKTGIILLAMKYDVTDIESLRRSLTSHHKAGVAFFCKQSLDGINQLCSIISGVHQQEVIIDHLITAVLAGNTKNEAFKNLTSRELEILSLLAMGYSNLAISEALNIGIQTVKHHINNMYGKLNLADDSKDRHPRVSAARMYLEVNSTPTMLLP